jgi:arginine deiminase
MKVVIICRPNDYAVTHANNNYNNNLFRTEVDINKMNNNYECLKSVMNKHMIKYIDLTEYMPDGRNYLDFANMLFVRDTFISTKKGIIIGNMKEKVRKYETQIIKYILQNRLFLNIMYECEEDEILEGGDFIHNDNTSFIAACTRTNMKAVKKLLEKDMFGTDKVVVIYTKNKDTDTIISNKSISINENTISLAFDMFSLIIKYMDITVETEKYVRPVIYTLNKINDEDENASKLYNKMFQILHYADKEIDIKNIPTFGGKKKPKTKSIRKS